MYIYIYIIYNHIYIYNYIYIYTYIHTHTLHVMYMIYVYIYMFRIRVSWDVVGTPEMSPHFGSCPRLLGYVSWSGMPTRGIGRSKSWRMRVPPGSGAPGTTAVVDRQLLGCWSPLGHQGGRCEDRVGTKPSIC